MAVYTHLNEEEITNLLKLYNIGNLISFHGIREGIENTNFFLKTSENEFILTIFEKRVNKNDLPFFINTMKHLSTQKFLCPSPIINIEDKYIQELKKKPAVIVNFLNGKSKTKITKEDCLNVGSNMASMHLKTKDLIFKRQNSLSFTGWDALIQNCINTIPTSILNEVEPNILEEIQNSFNFCKRNWPNKLPRGFIHADMFPDNVFFNNNKISGVIDFYFSCTDILAYDLAIAINAWCFDDNTFFNQEKFDSLIKGYSSKRKLSEQELFYLPLLSQAAAMRFLLTRLYDWVYTPKDATVMPKNPNEYIMKLRYHSKISINKNYKEFI